MDKIMFTLPKLPYDYGDLEPYIDEETMKIHHTKHHQSYVDNLNKTLEGFPDLQKKSIEDILRNINDIPVDIRQAVINNGGGHANHSFFWDVMTPLKTKPDDILQKMLCDKFGSIDKFKEAFFSKAMSVFGSGWAFLILNKDGQISLKRHSFHNSPLSSGNIPLMCVDVWEHAYYLKYRNRRADYLNAWWNVVNWDKISENLQKSQSG
jgi:Fe-Mn family superoxide dismutase